MPDTPTLTAAPDDEDRPVAEAERYGPYEVIGPLGAGGMGLVLEARDPALNRHVALKLLKPQRAWTAIDGGTRLVFEAQAMARLAHPNVVTVFEVGRVDEQVYVAMELVRGTTLRSWLRERPHRWRELVEMFLGAGRGLAAAHEAGLVHRDFKPDNVLIGADGRPRVTDFGLVVESSSHEETVLTEIVEATSDATFRGSIVGTPAYMSLEQWAGRGVDARTDQFAFCVALWEALFGQRPFAGTAPQDIRAAVQAGTITEPPRGRAPRWLLAVVRRGLARDPAARWPSMTALLDAIEHRMRLRRVWTIAAITALVAVASASVAAAVVATREGASPCVAPTARLASVWGEAARATLRQRLISVDPMQGAARYAKIATALDAGANGWSAMHVDACRATRVEGRQSDTLLDRRMDCLDRWLGELDNTVKVVAKVATLAEVDQAARAATSLSPLERCADTRALGEATTPTSAVARATVAALVAQIQEVDVAQRAAQYDGLAERAAALVSTARNLHNEPTLAAALVVQVRVLTARKNRMLAESPLRELVQVAARTRNDRDEAFAWMNLAPLPEQANLIESARAAVLRAGSPLDLEVDLLERDAALRTDSSRAKEALALLVQARRLLEQAGADRPGSQLGARLANIVFETGQSQLATGSYAVAAASYREAIERRRRLFGADNLDEANAIYHLALAQQYDGKLADALGTIEQAVRIYEARLGNSNALIRALVVQADILQSQQRWGPSVAIYDRALQGQRTTSTPDDFTLAAILIGRSNAAAHFGKLDEAAGNLTEAIAQFDAHHYEQLNLAIALFNRGDVRAQLRKFDEALRDQDRSLAVFAKVVEPGSHYLIYPLVGKATCLVLTGRGAEAIPLLERALAIHADVGDALQVARGKAYLGRARVETGRDAAGGLTMVRAARKEIATLPDGAEDVRWIDRWLATRR